MKINPEEDGYTHINVYSKGKTELGRLLSNFAYTPFQGGDHHFNSVEGWWYWFKTGKKHNYLKNLYGFKAKQEGRRFRGEKWITPEILKKVYSAKLNDNPHIEEMLKKNKLPFLHYYVWGEGKIKIPHEYLWTIELWNEI